MLFHSEADEKKKENAVAVSMREAGHRKKQPYSVTFCGSSRLKLSMWRKWYRTLNAGPLIFRIKSIRPSWVMRNEVFEVEEEKKHIRMGSIWSKSFYNSFKFFKMENCASATERAVILAPENRNSFIFQLISARECFNPTIHDGRVFVLDMTGAVIRKQ